MDLSSKGHQLCKGNASFYFDKYNDFTKALLFIIDEHEG